LDFKQETKYVAEGATLVFYSRFKNGVADESRFVSGSWKKITFGEPDHSFHTQKDSAATVSITSTEILVAYDYENLNGTKTTYALAIRRSTKRFPELFEAPDSDAAKDKNKPTNPNPQPVTQMNNRDIAPSLSSTMFLGDRTGSHLREAGLLHQTKRCNRCRSHHPHRKNNSHRPDKTRQPETSFAWIIKAI
jgi:hypothetical protein